MQYDVVTIGGGFSGLVTACRAAELGLSVAVLEERYEDRYPCSSRYATGAANVMGLPIMGEPDRLFATIMNGSGRNADPAVARAIAALSRFIAEHADRYAEIDINPLIVRAAGKGVVAVDALLVERG